jgi:hypothetical protein
LKTSILKLYGVAKFESVKSNLSLKIPNWVSGNFALKKYVKPFTDTKFFVEV